MISVRDKCPGRHIYRVIRTTTKQTNKRLLLFVSLSEPSQSGSPHGLDAFPGRIHNASDLPSASDQTQFSAMIMLTIVVLDSDPRRDSRKDLRKQFTVEGRGLTSSQRCPETDPLTAFSEHTHTPSLAVATQPFLPEHSSTCFFPVCLDLTGGRQLVPPPLGGFSEYSKAMTKVTFQVSATPSSLCLCKRNYVEGIIDTTKLGVGSMSLNVD